MSNVADARMRCREKLVSRLIMTTTRGGCVQLLLYCLHITGQQRWTRQPTREATDDDIKRCDADGNPRKPVGSAQPADVRRCSVIGDGEGEGDGVT
jgi:hypothetical protein